MSLGPTSHSAEEVALLDGHIMSARMAFMARKVIPHVI